MIYAAQSHLGPASALGINIFFERYSRVDIKRYSRVDITRILYRVFVGVWCSSLRTWRLRAPRWVRRHAASAGGRLLSERGKLSFSVGLVIVAAVCRLRSEAEVAAAIQLGRVIAHHADRER